VTGALTSRPWARLILGITLALVWVAPTRAQEKTVERREHVVKQGDTLWELARAYLSNPFLWPLIYEANRQIVEIPHRIFPAEKLVIQPLPGEKPVQVVAAAEPVVLPRPSNVRRTRFYSPPDTASAATLISAEQLRLRRVEPFEYYATPWLSDVSAVRSYGTLFKAAYVRPEHDKLTNTFHPFDKLYISYNGTTRPRPGDLLLVAAVGREVRGYGNVIEPTGVVQVDSLYATVMSARVTHQFGKMQIGDLVMPMDSFPALDRDPVPASGPDGVIVDFEVPQPVYGVTDRVFVNLGANSGVKVGDELAAMLPERRGSLRGSERLPVQTVARLLITRVAGRTATARVVHLEWPALENGLPVRVVARMP
jgi:hypothetical protein